MHQRNSTVQGSILVWTVLTIAILSILATEVVRLVSIKYESALQTATWQEALLGPSPESISRLSSCGNLFFQSQTTPGTVGITLPGTRSSVTD